MVWRGRVVEIVVVEFRWWWWWLGKVEYRKKEKKRRMVKGRVDENAVIVLVRLDRFDGTWHIVLRRILMGLEVGRWKKRRERDERRGREVGGEGKKSCSSG